MNLLLRWLVATVAILIAAYLVPGVEVAGVWPAIWIAVFLGLLNITVRPILIILTLPINVLTFGLFIFIINTLLILLVSTIIKGFDITGFLSALLFSVVLSIIGGLLNYLANSTRD